MECECCCGSGFDIAAWENRERVMETMHQARYAIEQRLAELSAVDGVTEGDIVGVAVGLVGDVDGVNDGAIFGAVVGCVHFS